MISYHIGGEMPEPEMEVHMEDAFLLFVIVGFLAQIVDGALEVTVKDGGAV